MRYFIIAGEASGDLHASNLMASLKKRDSEADFCFLGGDLMQAQGGKMVRHYRDMVNGGFLSFGEGMKVGVLIVLIPSLLFGIFDILYTEVINPGWMEQYYVNYESKLKATIPADKLESALKYLQAQKEIFSNPFLQFLLMALTVFIIGLIVTIISSLTLKKVKK